MEFENKSGLITLIILILASAVTLISQSIVTTSLPYYMHDFAISSATAQWTYSVFLLVLGVMIPPTAYITRRFKIKTILATSLILFIIGSVLCFVAPSIEILIIGRILEAMGTGILMPIGQILIFRIMPEEKWALFMGLFGFLVGIVPAMGPTVGGIIVDLFDWRFIFEVLAIIAVLILILSLILANFELETEKYPLDFPSLLLSILFCVGLMIGFSNVAEYGFSILYVILPIIVGIISLIVFVKRQNKIEKPLINLSVLKNKYFVYGTVFASLLYFIMCGINVIVPLFVQNVAYYSSTESGLILFPAAIIMIVFNFIGPVLADKIGIKPVLITSSFLNIIAFVAMMTYDMNSSFEYILATQFIRGIGCGLGLSPAITWSMSVVAWDVEDATAINNTARQVIGAIGSSIAVVIMQILASGKITHNQLSVNSFSLTSLMMIIITVIILIITVLFIKNKKDIVED
ncbi:MAG: DHA2 family efflux MFS transporter permease subunit [Methanobrevibacter sp.]|uniref:DHA2 family efflux MFS transporter permease subunit n=1 Tax=Methanobrevibacter sp. TaxID=66852 RepID=UPI001B12C164|nr:DHA2 family efflux MFS transporter permease subunit [Methanobrevibacter sp.]MBO6111158.1 DHA2 family efflux MFS transporter permease subunit [Methanobrevibacter sp.]MBP3791054.1 DHA2 family efflux MFS transporter permease subunit [Methanobrevibacter sp.]